MDISVVLPINLDKSMSTINTEELVKEQVQLNRLIQQFQRYSLEISFCLLFIAANVFFYGFEQQQKRQEISALLGQPLPFVVLGTELWLNPLETELNSAGVTTVGQQFTVGAAPTGDLSNYETISIGDINYHVPKAVLVKSSLINYFIVNLLLIAAFVIAYRWQRTAYKLQDEILDINNHINDLLHDAQLPIFAKSLIFDKLAMLGNTLQSQQRRQQEIRHLVRVQGLIDHDLAIGNRIFFESKLQHYLVEPNEPRSGSLFLLQITNPEHDVHPLTVQQRMAGCVELLTQLTNHLPQAILARVADQDLALLIPGLGQKEAEDLGDRVAMVLSKSSYFAGLSEQDVLHLGYVIYQQGQSSYQVLAEADMALKTAQLQGPNAAYGFYPSAKPKIKGSVWWRTELTNALREQRFMLSFQPVFSSAQHDVIQHEVLVRLQSSEGDQLPAAIFLPMAANCGLTAKIDEYVVLKAAKLCQLENLGSARCSVNLSVSTMLQNEWWDWLSEMLKNGKIAPGQFAFEVDEYHILRQYKVLKPKLLRLSNLGFSVIIDHVGLSIEDCPYMNEIAIEAIKLHPSVIRGIDKQLEQQLYIRGLLASNTQQQARVIACGVETQAEWQTLQKLGISAAQGFYFSQPLAKLMAQNIPN